MRVSGRRRTGADLVWRGRWCSMQRVLRRRRCRLRSIRCVRRTSAGGERREHVTHRRTIWTTLSSFTSTTQPRRYQKTDHHYIYVGNPSTGQTSQSLSVPFYRLLLLIGLFLFSVLLICYFLFCCRG